MMHENSNIKNSTKIKAGKGGQTQVLGFEVFTQKCITISTLYLKVLRMRATRQEARLD
jgi:hypothetical protein